jgi:hypothetical protein
MKKLLEWIAQPFIDHGFKIPSVLFFVLISFYINDFLLKLGIIDRRRQIVLPLLALPFGILLIYQLERILSKFPARAGASAKPPYISLMLYCIVITLAMLVIRFLLEMLYAYLFGWEYYSTALFQSNILFRSEYYYFWLQIVVSLVALMFIHLFFRHNIMIYKNENSTTLKVEVAHFKNSLRRFLADSPIKKYAFQIPIIAFFILVAWLARDWILAYSGISVDDGDKTPVWWLSIPFSVILMAQLEQVILKFETKTKEGLNEDPEKDLGSTTLFTALFTRAVIVIIFMFILGQILNALKFVFSSLPAFMGYLFSLPQYIISLLIQYMVPLSVVSAITCGLYLSFRKTFSPLQLNNTSLEQSRDQAVLPVVESENPPNMDHSAQESVSLFEAWLERIKPRHNFQAMSILASAIISIVIAEIPVFRDSTHSAILTFSTFVTRPWLIILIIPLALLILLLSYQFEKIIIRHDRKNIEKFGSLIKYIKLTICSTVNIFIMLTIIVTLVALFFAVPIMIGSRDCGEVCGYIFFAPAASIAFFSQYQINIICFSMIVGVIYPLSRRLFYHSGQNA